MCTPDNQPSALPSGNRRFSAAVFFGLLCALLPAEVTAQGWEVDWEAVGRIGAAVSAGIQASPFAEQIAALSDSVEVDWELVGKLTAQVLDGTSWEQAAALRPLAEQALARLDTLEGGEVAAAWFRQRLGYLQVAERYVNEQKKPPVAPLPVAPPPGSPTVPRKPVSVPPVRHTVKLDTDTQLWIRRLPAEPAPAAQRLAPALRRIFEAEGVPPALLWLAEVESSFNPAARSPVGAAGLYQFMPATATRFGLALEPVDQRLDPELSAAAAARYLRILYGRFADWPLALAAYNAGEGRVGRALRIRGARSFEDIADGLPVETRMYVPRIAAVVQHREGADLRLLPAPSRAR